MAVYPGATFKPTSFGGRTPRNRQGRGILHVAVSERVSYPPFSGNTWHFYVAKDGTCEQYVDTDFVAWASVDANDDALSIETAGAANPATVNSEPWTPAQCARIADIMRWEASQPGGAPLEQLPDSRAGRRGWGPHRLGIKHSAGPRPGWWQPGGEVWSNALGKECPGDAKVAQVPQIIQLARSGDDMPLNQDDLNKISVVVKQWAQAAVTEPTIDWGGGRKVSVAQQVADNTSALADLADLVKSLAGTSAGSKVSLPTEFDLSSIARAVADELDRRDRDNDPDTGRSS
jgi:hypothetical protein